VQERWPFQHLTTLGRLAEGTVERRRRVGERALFEVSALPLPQSKQISRHTLGHQSKEVTIHRKLGAGVTVLMIGGEEMKKAGTSSDRACH
jgi:hypothetical protein